MRFQGQGAQDWHHASRSARNKDAIMAVLSTGFRPKTTTTVPAEVRRPRLGHGKSGYTDLITAHAAASARLNQDISMTDASDNSSSEDNSGSEDAAPIRQYKQAHRPSAQASGRRWFSGFGYLAEKADCLCRPVLPSARPGSARTQCLMVSARVVCRRQFCFSLLTRSADDELPSKRVSRHF